MWILLGIITLTLALLVIYFGVMPRIAAVSELDKEQDFNTQRTVVFATARLAAAKSELPLPCTIEAFQEASIYARTNGYVKKWLVDIGDRVHEGDVLAILDTPEIDQQLAQAKATAMEQEASLKIAQTAAERWNIMVAQHAVSQEEADEKNATRNEAQATFNGASAEVARLSALEDFKVIRAPFGGTITYRRIEVGNLINSGNTNGTELYRVAQTDPLRIYVDVPEANTPSSHPGVEADIHIASAPTQVFHGEVVRDAGALDTTSRTLRTEIHVANPNGLLLPGTYAEVRLNLSDATPSILIPANTLIVSASGTLVARIEHKGGSDQIHYLPVKVGRDFGTEVEILDSEIKDGDELVTNPAADLAEGTKVTAKPIQQTASAGTPPAVAPPRP